MPILIIVLLVVLFLILTGLKVINQYERGIVLTLGSYSYTLSPGLRVIVPIFQRVIKVDIRI
ncbi:MAG: SPFH domain-containing protein, partial [Candidatus Woesebacteria bacterium]|nr:SPFH domain-containing protein [Candidatus Woesebacteria bacterium]